MRTSLPNHKSSVPGWLGDLLKHYEHYEESFLSLALVV